MIMMTMMTTMRETRVCVLSGGFVSRHFSLSLVVVFFVDATAWHGMIWHGHGHGTTRHVHGHRHGMGMSTGVVWA